MSNAFVTPDSNRTLNFTGARGTLASRVADFVDRHGSWLIYVRRDTRYPHADCYLSDTKSPDPKCEVCFGIGYKIQLEKHKVRRSVAFKEMNSPNAPFGYQGEYNAQIHSRRDYNQRQLDLYFEVEWDVSLDQIEQYGRPTRIVDSYQIDETKTAMESGVTYRVCNIHQHNFQSPLFEDWLLTNSHDWVVWS